MVKPNTIKPKRKKHLNNLKQDLSTNKYNKLAK